MQQNQQFQRVLDYEKMVELTYLPVEKTPDEELGKRLNALGYEHKKTNKGASYRMKER